VKRTISIGFAVLLCLFYQSVHAQSLKREAGKFIDDKIYSSIRSIEARRTFAQPGATPKHSYDVLHYELILDLTESLNQSNHEYTGEVFITLRVDTTELASVDLHAENLTISSVMINNSSAPVAQPVGGSLIVPLDRTYVFAETLELKIAYSHTTTDNIGYYFYPKGATSGNLVADEPVAYTFSEPYDARYWFPCFDEPYDKASATIRVVVPEGFVATSNGTLTSISDDGSGRLTYTWNQYQPIATYLMAVTVSKFVLATASYAKATNPTESIPVEYYVWSADSLTAAGFLPRVVEMMEFYAATFGEYPFDKYGMTGIAPFAYGGMEHQTITTLRRDLIANESVVAHELVHQWWGNLVTCGTWADIWLNEGFATYGDALFSEHRYGPEVFQSRMNSFAQSYFSYDATIRHPIYDPWAYTSNLFNVNEYQKAAWVLHMLRGVLGDSAFFSIFPTYGEKFAFSNAITEDFIALVDSIAGRDVRWFFDQWIYDQGHPEYRYSWEDLGGTVQISVSQLQANAPIFKMPIEFLIRTTSGDVLEVVWDSLQVQKFEVPVPGAVTKVIIDPNNKILKQAELTDGGIPEAFLLRQNYPNPFNASTTIEYDVPQRSFVRIDVYNLLGQKVASFVDQLHEPGFYRLQFSADQLASGIYFYRLRAEEISARPARTVTQTRTMVVLK